jgi:type IV secretion system protein VirB3
VALKNDSLFVGATRPATLFRVSYSGVILNIMIVMSLFMNLGGNPLYLLLAIPIHLVMALLTIQEPRFFELLGAWLKTVALVRFRRFWKGASYGR